MQKGRAAEAKRELERFNGGADVRAESAEIHRDLQAGAKHSGWRDLIGPTVRPAVLVGSTLAAFDHFTGINTIMYWFSHAIETRNLGRLSSPSDVKPRW